MFAQSLEVERYRRPARSCHRGEKNRHKNVLTISAGAIAGIFESDWADAGRTWPNLSEDDYLLLREFLATPALPESRRTFTFLPRMVLFPSALMTCSDDIPRAPRPA